MREREINEREGPCTLISILVIDFHVLDFVINRLINLILIIKWGDYLAFALDSLSAEAAGQPVLGVCPRVFAGAPPPRYGGVRFRRGTSGFGKQ